MSFTADTLLLASLGYAALLFLVAFVADWRAAQGRWRWMDGPLVYTLSISVYCTSWTFYGAVGSAARDGLEFATIYLGPTLVFIGWSALMLRLVRIGRAQRITSIADFISSRYGKSPWLAALATIMATAAAAPYIALQLKAISSSFHLIVGASNADAGWTAPAVDQMMYRTAFWVAAGLALFAILFGTRNLDANARHHGVVAAIALEAVIKLAALLAVALFAAFGAPGSMSNWAQGVELTQDPAQMFTARWGVLIFLSAAAVICLPRQFQVTVVECVDERNGRVASWLFPLYLLLTSLCAPIIAAAGAQTAPPGADPDFYVLALPLSLDAGWLALLAFIGGFSSATSMVIVSCIALSTMISNHLVMPISLRIARWARTNRLRRGWQPTDGPEDVRDFLLTSRRMSICAVLLLGFIYFRLSPGGEALASIGLISFAGAAQFIPALLAALFWRRATGVGAAAGLLGGFTLWLWLLFLPTFWPEAGLITAEDPLLEGVLWSLSANLILLIAGSLLSDPTPIEQVQGALFADPRHNAGAGAQRAIHRSATAQDLYLVARRILGDQTAHEAFDTHRKRQNIKAGWPAADDALIHDIERRMAGGVGAASARAMVGRVTTGETVSLSELMRIADENAQLLHYSQQLETKSAELEAAAKQLREANDRLRALDEQKDEFLSQVSHELRTPMTSLCAFSEFLLTDDNLGEEQRTRFIGIIHRESLRLTRILDQILDLNQLERREIDLAMAPVDINAVMSRAIFAAVPPVAQRKPKLHRSDAPSDTQLIADADRLQQVFMNVLANAMKYADAQEPSIWIDMRRSAVGDALEVFISDDGPGIAAEDRARVFAKFTRAVTTANSSVGGVGLGLAISREIMRLHGGEIDIDDSTHGGATFRISIPLSQSNASAPVG